MSNIWTYNISRWLYLKRVPILPKVFSRLTRIVYSCEIPYTAEIHPSVTFSDKGLGVVIGHDTIIGENTKILQNVTIGGRNGIRANPKIGSNVLIGANAVVIKDVPENSTAIGVPAKIIK